MNNYIKLHKQTEKENNVRKIRDCQNFNQMLNQFLSNTTTINGNHDYKFKPESKNFDPESCEEINNLKKQLNDKVGVKLEFVVCTNLHKIITDKHSICITKDHQDMN